MSGYAFSQEPFGFSMMVLTVATSDLEALGRIVRLANEEAAAVEAAKGKAES